MNIKSLFFKKSSQTSQVPLEPIQIDMLALSKDELSCVCGAPELDNDPDPV